MEKIVCRRCGKVMEKRHYMLQTVVYLGEWCPRIDICDDCHTSYIMWLANGHPTVEFVD